MYEKLWKFYIYVSFCKSGLNIPTFQSSFSLAAQNSFSRLESHSYLEAVFAKVHQQKSLIILSLLISDLFHTFMLGILISRDKYYKQCCQNALQ